MYTQQNTYISEGELHHQIDKAITSEGEISTQNSEGERYHQSDKTFTSEGKISP